MSTATCCLPTVIATRPPWHRRAWRELGQALREGLHRWRRERRHAACVASLRHLPAHALRDVGLAECVHDAPTLPRVDWEFGRWQ